MSTERSIDRRRFLFESGGGLGGIALTSLLGDEGLLPEGVARHHRPTAQRVVQLFMSGAASQCDLFDYKPLLIARHGKPTLARAFRTTAGRRRRVMGFG